MVRSLPELLSGTADHHARMHELPPRCRAHPRPGCADGDRSPSWEPPQRRSVCAILASPLKTRATLLAPRGRRRARSRMIYLCNELLQLVRTKITIEIVLPTNKESIILRLLLEHGAMYGLQLVDTSDGHLVRGTVYATLSRLEEKGFVESRRESLRPEAIGPPRRLYTITALGRRALEASELAFA